MRTCVAIALLLCTCTKSPPVWQREAESILSTGTREPAALQRVATVLAAAAPKSPAERAAHAALRGRVHLRAGRFPDARLAFEEALAADQDARQPEQEVDHLATYLVAATLEGRLPYDRVESMVVQRQQHLAQVPKAQVMLPFYLGQFARERRRPGAACQAFTDAAAAARRLRGAEGIDDLEQAAGEAQATSCELLSRDSGAARWFADQQRWPAAGTCAHARFLANYAYSALVARARDFWPGRSRPLAPAAVGPGFPTPAQLLPGRSDATLTTILDVVEAARERDVPCLSEADRRRVALNRAHLACQEGRPATLPPAIGLSPEEGLARLEIEACLAQTAPPSGSGSPAVAESPGDASAIIQRWLAEAVRLKAPEVAFRARLRQATCSTAAASPRRPWRCARGSSRPAPACPSPSAWVMARPQRNRPTKSSQPSRPRRSPPRNASGATAAWRCCAASRRCWCPSLRS